MLWSEPEPNLPNNYGSALGQLFSLKRSFQRDPNLKELFQQSIDTDVEKGFEVPEHIGSQRHIWKGMIFATPSSTKPQQTG